VLHHSGNDAGLRHQSALSRARFYRAIHGIGDEAIDQVSAIAFRKGDNCFMRSGWRSYLDSAEHPVGDLPNKILSRL